MVHLRALKGAAPLKQGEVDAGATAKTYLRALKGAAPLKHTIANEQRGLIQDISAPSKARPR